MTHIQNLVLSISLAFFACADKDNKEEQKALPPTEHTKAPPIEQELPAVEEAEPRSCKEEAAELRTFLTNLFDRDAQLEAPWPTGDAEVDEWIEEARLKLRKLTMPAGPSNEQEMLTDGIDTSVDEVMYRDCPEGLAALQAVSTAAPDKRTEAFIRIADAVEACDCEVNIARLKAAYYMGQRGPD